MAKPRLPKGFPLQDVFRDFLRDYANRSSYWYIPKARTLNDANVEMMAQTIDVISDGFLDEIWNPETQDRILEALQKRGIVDPTTKGPLTDRTALVRISKKLLETLGLLWVREDHQIVLTDMGLALWLAETDDDRREVIEQQIAKYQYPSPNLGTGYASEFDGLVPHIFLLQVLQQVGYEMTDTEFQLFVNLAQSHDDVQRVVRYLTAWRQLSRKEREQLEGVAERVRGPTGGRRHRTIALDSSYQRAFFAYPRRLRVDEHDGELVISCAARREDVDRFVGELDLKVPAFSSQEAWIAYYGDPDQQPDWFTYLYMEIERAETKEDADELVKKHKGRVTEEQAEELERKQVEKYIEDFYEKNLHMLEPGLRLVKDGRQYETPIGPMDLLCKSKDGTYVVVEIKAKEAEDSVFGQIQRYMGWVHTNVSDGRDNVRGIILAEGFPDKARYSRIGLLRKDHKEFLKFKKHGLTLEEVG